MHLPSLPRVEGSPVTRLEAERQGSEEQEGEKAETELLPEDEGKGEQHVVDICRVRQP